MAEKELLDNIYISQSRAFKSIWQSKHYLTSFTNPYGRALSRAEQLNPYGRAEKTVLLLLNECIGFYI